MKDSPYGSQPIRTRYRTKNVYGARNRRLYVVWRGMKGRCYCSSNGSWKNYGGRGVSVCDDWLFSFWTFRDWAMSNGFKVGLQIDRIDNNGNYESDNCRWATRSLNARNGRQKRTGNYTSRFKGVSQYRGRRWRVNIRCDGCVIHLGCFDSEIEAAKAYNRKAIQFFGDDACINKIEVT